MSIKECIDTINKYLACDLHIRKNLNYCLRKQNKTLDGNCSLCEHNYSESELRTALNKLIRLIDSDGCVGCKYTHKDENTMPCLICKNRYTNQWTYEVEENDSN